MNKFSTPVTAAREWPGLIHGKHDHSIPQHTPILDGNHCCSSTSFFWRAKEVTGSQVNFLLSIIVQPFFNREQGVSLDPDGARLAWRWFIQRRRSIIARLRLALDSDVWHVFPLGKKGAYDIYEPPSTPNYEVCNPLVVYFWFDSSHS